MKKECSIVRDLLPLYFENMLSEDTAAFVREHIENCSGCAAELEAMKSGKQIDEATISQRKQDAKVILVVKKEIIKKIVKMVAGICLVFAFLFIAVMFYTSISYPVTKDNVALSTVADGGYTYIILDTEAGKSLSFDSKTENILNEQNEVCGIKITLYNLQYHNNFAQNNNSVIWGCPADIENGYMEVVLELENDTLQISNRE